ncbi:MAG: 5-(carboxyamino)imidazole ribonucleotide synthase [Pseudomonadota bacterium]
MTSKASIPNITLGILGGGQLGRMSALAASNLGIKTHIYAPDGNNCPAAQVSTAYTQGNYDNVDMLKTFGQKVDVISYEFENIPVETVQLLQKIKPVYPGDNLLDIAQNRIKEKQFLNDIGIQTAPWTPAYSVDDISQAMQIPDFTQCILKTTRFGYDGKDQIFQKDSNTIEESWKQLNSDELIIEGVVDFSCEISVLVARGRSGDVKCYPPTVNEHSNHILAKTVHPAPIGDDIRNGAIAMATRLAEKVELIGILGLELFVTRDGELLANEIAPRTHNSGHWTIDACAVSQFEQHVRAVCGLPLGSTEPHSPATMINLIGDDVLSLDQYLNMPNACIHLYGKDEVKPGRKMGHVTILNPDHE